MFALTLARGNRKGWLAHLVHEAIDASSEFSAMLDAAAPEYPSFAKLRAAAAAPSNGGVSIFDTCYFKRRPLVDRAGLRQSLRYLHGDDDDAARILIVRGDRYSGKSYTSDFIHHLGTHLGFRTRRVKLLEQTAEKKELTPQMLADAIVAEMKLPADLPNVEHDSVAWWKTYWLDALAKNLYGSEETWWIVIDDFPQVNVSDAVYEFIDAMARKVDESLDSLRLILIGFDRELPEELEPVIEIERTQPITDVHLVDYFAQFLRDHVSAIDAEAAPQVIANAVKVVRDEMSKRDERNRLVGMMAGIARQSRALMRGEV
jgi:hypothetical protein